MAAGAITIGLEKFMLAPNLEGSINHQPLTVFRDQYGVEMTDTATLDLFKRVFASGLAKDAIAERIAQLTAKQKERILVALNKRLGLFTRNLATLQNTTLENKRVALNKLINDITRNGAKSPAPGPGAVTPTGPAVVLNEIVETVASPTNTPEVAQEKKTKRANFLQRILIIAYYLANPSKLRALDQSVYNAMSDLVIGLNGVKTPSQLTNILALVQAGAKADDVRALDPLNYFEMISMPKFLESPDLEQGVTNKIITPLTNESLLSSYVTKLMGLMAIEGTVDEDRIKALKECLQGEGACIDKGRKEKGEELGGKLTTAIKPLYEIFGKMYGTLFSEIKRAMKGIQPKPFYPIMNMLKVFSHVTTLPKSILKTAPKTDVTMLEPGMYKYTEVPAELMQFIRKLNEQYGKVAKPLSELKLGQDMQYVYLPENIPIITSTSQMRIPEARASATPSIAALQSQLASQKASAKSAREALKKAKIKIELLKTARSTEPMSKKDYHKTINRIMTADTDKATAAQAMKKADELVAATLKQIEELEKTPDAPAPETTLTEDKKREILADITSFFTKEPTTLYILSGGKANTVPFKLFTGSSEDTSFNPVHVSTPNSIKISNVLPDIVNDTGSKPISMSAFMFAGFIAFKRGLSELTKEADVSAPVPSP